MTAMRDVWGEKLVEFGHADPRTVVLDGDLANSTKADKFAKAHPDRFFQMGIAEQNLVGAAAGLAAVGYVPWTSSFTVFFTHRAIDPIRMLVAQSHANVKIVGSYSGLLIGAVGKTHLDIAGPGDHAGDARPDRPRSGRRRRAAGHDGLGPGLRRPGLPPNRPRRRTRPVRRRLHLHAGRHPPAACRGPSQL